MLLHSGHKGRSAKGSGGGEKEKRGLGALTHCRPHLHHQTGPWDMGSGRPQEGHGGRVARAAGPTKPSRSWLSVTGTSIKIADGLDVRDDACFARDLTDDLFNFNRVFSFLL